MTYVLIIMSAFSITGFEDANSCMVARDIVIKQFGRNLDAGAVCVPRPKNGEVIGRGAQSKNDNDAD
jgi:hypothetical protein